jgi:hypothetical protein
MDEAKASQSGYPGSITGKVRNGDAFLVSHHHHVDGASSSQKNADLASDLIRNLGEETANFRGNNVLGRDFPSIDTFDLLDLAGL